jgi:glycosyltransferase involved in cell wall biosynthesis
MPTNPYFSIVVPVYNRAREVRRAIDSCLAQDFPGFEVIAVDGNSADSSAEVVAGYADPRVRLIRQPRNLGVCPARNAAIRASRGSWMIYVDSDHELLPGCLARVYRVASSDEALGVGRLGFMYDYDDGGTSPDPLPPPGVLGYEDWLRFINGARRSDALLITRRETFDACMMPESFACEFGYNLDFSKRFAWKIVPEVVALQHTDSPDRTTLCRPQKDARAALRRDTDWLNEWNRVLAEHGGALRALAPARYQGVLRGRAICYNLTGQRLRAVRAAAACASRFPAERMNWAVLAGALAGPGLTRRARSWRARRIAAAGGPRRDAGPPALSSPGVAG